MAITAFVLHLVSDRLAAGQLVGSVEEVESGEREACGSVEDLVAFILRCGEACAAPPGPDRGSPSSADWTDRPMSSDGADR